MIDPSTEKLISLATAMKLVAPVDGRSPSPCTGFRWHVKGVSGVRLECARVGRRIVTTERCIREFINKVAEVHTPPPRPRLDTPPEPAGRRTPEQRERDVSLARERLAKAGI